MLNTAFPDWPSFTPEEADAVSRVLLSNRVNYWTGEECRKFETEFATYVGSRHAVALSNGTLALDVALRALDIGPGDEVIVTPRSFMASASCVVTAGATPIFADIDPDSQNLTAESIARVLTPRTKAVIPVHLAGWPCDMDPIMALARDRGFFVIEDCAQAHGARYKGRSVGSIGHVGAWSFCQDKIMTTAGEGGMVTTDDEALWSRMWSYKDHGKSYDAVYNRSHEPGYRWVHETFGTNWRMLEVQGVVGRIQLRRMKEWHARRTQHARRLTDGFNAIAGLRVPPLPADHTHAWYKFYAFVRPEMLGGDWDRDRIMVSINTAGVPCTVGSCSEIYLENAFAGSSSRPCPRLPVARELGETSLCFLVHPTLEDRHIDRTVEVVRDVMHEAAA
jgi:dTDP-4-amino-4,6-dideoxygalactose transaminase